MDQPAQRRLFTAWSRSLRAKALAAYMCAAAAASLRQASICAAATTAARWFTLHYANARHCSASCRAARFNNRNPRMASFRKITTRKGATRWQSRWRVPGTNGRLQDRAQNFATRKEAAAHAARMRDIECRGVGDPHRHDLAGYLRGMAGAPSRARRPRTDHAARLRAQCRPGGAALRPCLAREAQRRAISIRSMPSC